MPCRERSLDHSLSTFDQITLAISVVGASVLWLLRRHHGRKHAAGQWIGDALTVGTMVVVFAIGVDAIFGNVLGLGAVANANHLLIAIACVYSVGMLILQLWKSACRDDRDADGDG